MKYLLTLTALLAGICHPEWTLAQTLDLGGSTYAVVIGISDYQDKDIPDLRFADRDAGAFANYLRSPAGGSLDGDHLKVLTNEQATAGRIAEALDGLIEQAKEDDQVIIYFSGHGDVEGKKISQPGFLLCWDSPSRVYMGGGTYSLSFLQEVVTTLSVQNKARVTVITDACHAGKLAGSQIGGAQLTSANLAKQYANEVKILSCQPGEFSLEGEQWGGGRGVFSYHLVDGLFGLADRNGDGTVSVGEIDRYLEDHVTTEAAPQSQVPMLMGNKTERLATVNAAVLADLQKHKAGGMPTFAATESRGFEDEVLAKVDTTVREMYRAFKLAVQEKRFFPSLENVGRVANPSDVQPVADELFTQLTQVEALAPLRGIMKRNYAAALQDDAQQTLNEWLKATPDATKRLTEKSFTEKVRSYPRCLDRAAELLGEQHYMYTALKARKYFFEGYLEMNSSVHPSQESVEHSLYLFRQSLHWQPGQPHVYWKMSTAFGRYSVKPDSLEYYARLAMELQPNWTRPCLDAAIWLTYEYNQPGRAKPFLEQASRIDSSSAEVRIVCAGIHRFEKNYGEAERQMKIALALDSAYYLAWRDLGNVYLMTRRFAEAEWAFKKVIALDSTGIYGWANLGGLYLKTQRFAEAEPMIMKALTIDSTAVLCWSDLGDLYHQTRRPVEAEWAFKKAVAQDSTFDVPLIKLGNFYVQTRRYAEAEQVFKKVIALDSPMKIRWNNPWSNLGYLYMNTGRYPEAETAYKKAIALDSTNSMRFKELGDMYIEIRRYDEAESFLKKAILLDSTHAFNWWSLGNLYNPTQRYDEAIQAYKKSIALDSTYASPWNNLGYAYLNTERYKEAEPALKKAIALDSTFAYPRKHLGMVCFKTNRPEEARQNFLKAIALDPNYWKAKVCMSYLLTAEEKTEEAIAYVEQAIGKGATFEQLEKDEDLAPLRERTEQWQALVKKHFPDQAKD